MPATGEGAWRRVWPVIIVLMCSCQALPRTELPVGKTATTENSRQGNPSVTTRAAAIVPISVGPIAPAAFTSPPNPNYQSGPAFLPANGGPECWGNGYWTGSDVANRATEEYVCNGGDHETEVLVKQDWTVHGLHSGDTVIHYDTVDGKTRVAASNDVCLYAPRFAAIRKVYGPLMSEQHNRAAGIELPVTVVQSGDIGEPTTVVQPLQAGRRHAISTAQQFRERTRGLGVDNAQMPASTQDRFLPFEDLTVIRRGEFDNSEKARLAERLQAAIAWTQTLGPQVAIDNKTAQQTVGTTDLESIYTYVIPPGKSRLRVVKIASKQNARSGDTVEFTIRFDNVGDQLIGNVTVLDRLHDRLEYLVDSQSCTFKAEFLTEDEEGSPRVLRWEINEPMKVGAGGIIRFQCRVR